MSQLSTKAKIWIAVAIIILLAGLFYFFYKRGKKQVTLQQLPSELAGNSGGGAGASNDELKVLANSMFTDMDGFNIFGHNGLLYERAVLLNDSDTVKLYNAFNAMYQPKHGETLTQALINEKFVSNAPDLLISKLQKLNCI